MVLRGLGAVILLTLGGACVAPQGDALDTPSWEAQPLGQDPSEGKQDVSAAQRAFSEGVIINDQTPIYALRYTTDPGNPVELTEITTGYNSRLPAHTPVGVFGIDHGMGLVQISEWGHFVRIADVAPNEGHPRFRPWDQVATAAPHWTGQVLRNTAVHRHVLMHGTMLDTPVTDSLAAGTTVGVYGYVAHDVHGTWALVRSASDFQIVDARDLVIDGTYTLDTRHYQDRMLILERLETAYPYAIPDTGHAWTDDPNYGIELQTRWQADSGRAFEDGAGRAQGWWANANYTLSVWPMLALQQRGEFPELHLVTPVAGQHGGWSDDPRFQITPSASAGWHEYYDQRRHYQQYGWTGAPEIPAKHLQQLMWDVHVESIHEGLSRNEDLLTHLPAGERQFADSWGSTVVEYLAVANFPTGEVTLDFIQRVMLPGRLVNFADLTGTPSDLPLTVTFGIMSMNLLHEYETATNYSLLRLWERATDIAEANGNDEVAYYALRSAIETASAGPTQMQDLVDHLFDGVRCAFDLTAPSGELCEVQRGD